jgi:NADH:ubiquinone oxidoreductase subunit F (NADH-binding)
MTVIESHPGAMKAPIQTVGEPRLLAGLLEHDRVDYGTHRRLHGVVPRLNRQEYERRCEAVDLRGRGGASFPVSAKLRSLPRRGAPVVVVNGSESEPASFKDRTLMRRVPHIVLDGALGVAAAVRARRVMFAVHDRASAESLRWAIAERPDAAQVQVRETQGWFVAGEARAVVRSLEGGPAVPPGRRTPPTVRGLHGRPTFVSNVETYAQLAVLAHRGVHVYAATGLASEPGTLLVTLGGAVSQPCVAEIPQGTPLSVLLRLAGAGSRAGVLLGGYDGSWWADGDVAVTPGALRAHGATLGAGVVLVLDERTCPLAELHRVSSWLAAQSVRQCGPCMFGLPALADDVRRLAVGDVSGLRSLERHVAVVPGRGACAHPDGVVRFVASGLRAFWSDAQTHLERGHCGRPLLGELPLESPVVRQAPEYAWSPR